MQWKPETFERKNNQSILGWLIRKAWNTIVLLHVSNTKPSFLTEKVAPVLVPKHAAEFFTHTLLFFLDPKVKLMAQLRV